MAKAPIISFSKNALPKKGGLAILIPEGGKLPRLVADSPASAQIERAMETEKFTGKKGSMVSILGADDALERVILIGCGKLGEQGETDWLKIGGKIFAAAGKSENIFVLTEKNKTLFTHATSFL